LTIYSTALSEKQNIEGKHKSHNILTVAVCLTEEDITTGLRDIFAEDFAKV